MLIYTIDIYIYVPVSRCPRLLSWSLALNRMTTV
jgi:hypothetical protein